MSVVPPNRPAGSAFDDFMASDLVRSSTPTPWESSDGPLPALFVSHGAPPLFDDREWIDGLFAWAQGMPRPTGIVIISAHWEAAPLTLSSPGAATPLVYDFSGFDPRYFSMTYPTPDAGELADRVEQAFGTSQGPIRRSARGLDHGAWVPLKVMYPDAGIPVLQISVPTADPAQLLELGRFLEPLRHQGVLVIGSGFLTHGLAYLSAENFLDNVVPPWSADFTHWATEALAAGDVETLMEFHRAPGMPYAHPTVEHFVPLFVTLGASGDPSQPARIAIDGYRFGLSRVSFETGRH